MDETLVLASASPRRRDLLEQIGVPVKICPVDLDEQVQPYELGADYVERLAIAKAQAGFEAGGSSLPALGSDTAVVLDGQILGKPANRRDGIDTLLSLSGRSHQVMTGVAIANAEKCLSQVVITEVEFISFDEALAERYWNTGEPRDKAGSYGIQGKGAVLVANINGSYSAVVGLPLAETAELLGEFGVDIWTNSES